MTNQIPAGTPAHETATPHDLLPWYVAHTRPRCEKKLGQHCEREGISFTLPCYRSVKKYRGKTVVFQKPLFPNYVFLRLFPEQKRKIYQSDYVANLLDVVDQKLFQAQLGDILLALDTDLEIFLAPQITPGSRVKIKSGPLRGIEGIVEHRAGFTLVLLRLEFIGQAAAVKIDASELELT
jgi:transcription antitermination factor NusG